MKALAAGIGVVVLSPFLLGGATLLTATASRAAASNGALPCLPEANTGNITQQVTKILDGADPSYAHMKGLDVPSQQIPHAQTIVATGIDLHVPPRGQIIALATALRESRLRNLTGGDRDSLGLFQQRPSQGWGTAEQIRDPIYASTQFYQALQKVRGWQQMTVTQAAQAVQKSAYPDAYAQWEPLARALQQAIAAGIPSAGQNDKDKDAETAPSPPDCGPANGSSFGRIPEGTVPKGYEIPKSTAPRARTAIVWAMHQLGTMYQWGGSCTAPHGPDPMGRCDCSSLVQQAYAHAGIHLTRTTYTQVDEGKAVSEKAMEPGDLIFARGTAARPEHVGMYLGEGLVIEAPHTGARVRISPLRNWAVLAVRRVL